MLLTIWNREDTDLFLLENVGCVLNELDGTVDRCKKITILKNMGSQWERMEDHELFQLIELDTYLQGDLYIITDLIYREKAGLFQTTFEELPSFIETYRNQYKEVLINGDTAFISPTTKTILYFHHEGYWMTAPLPLVNY